MGQTTNLKLYTTASYEVEKTFLDYRTELSGTGSDSNMNKIDKAYGDLDSKIDTKSSNLDTKITQSTSSLSDRITNNVQSLNSSISAINDTLNTLQGRIDSSYNFKGIVATVNDLPSSGNQVNDTYFVSSLNHRMTWTGSQWKQSSPDEPDYIDIKEDSNATKLFLDQTYARLDLLHDYFQQNLSSNGRIINLYKNMITYEPPSSMPSGNHGSAFGTFLISKEPRDLGAAASFTERLTDSDFTSFKTWDRADLTVEVELLEAVTEKRSPSYYTIGTISRVLFVTKNMDTHVMTVWDPFNLSYTQEYNRRYKLSIKESFPEAYENKNLAVIFQSTFAATKGCIKVVFKNEHISMPELVESKIDATNMFLTNIASNLDAQAPYYSKSDEHPEGVGPTNRRKIHLYKNTVYCDHDSTNPSATGSTFSNFIISKNVRYVGTGDPSVNSWYTRTSWSDSYNLTDDDFISFYNVSGSYDLILTLDVYSEITQWAKTSQGLDRASAGLNYFTIVTKTDEDSEDDDNNNFYSFSTPRDTFTRACHRRYELNVSKELPQLANTKKLAVLFTSVLPAIQSYFKLSFYFKPKSEIDGYWDDEIEVSTKSINHNIMNAGIDDPTILFITDCHWGYNQKKSPEIAKEILDNCNINQFVNGGDMIYRTFLTKDGYTKEGAKQAAVDQLTQCIAAFPSAGCRLPMIALYGNHDRNRDGQEGSDRSDWTLCMTKAEHLRLSLNRQAKNYYDIHYLDNSGAKDSSGNLLVSDPVDAFYWEDSVYRYAAVYYHGSSPREITWLDELFNTEKDLVIFTHGIWFSLGSARSPSIDTRAKENGDVPYGIDPETNQPLYHTRNRVNRWLLFGSNLPLLSDVGGYIQAIDDYDNITAKASYYIYTKPSGETVVRDMIGSAASDSDPEVGTPVTEYCPGLMEYANKIKCIVQGHAHWDALRVFKNSDPNKDSKAVPLILIDQDSNLSKSTTGTITEQSLSAITIKDNEIRIVKIGRGKDWPVIQINSNTGVTTSDFTYDYTNGVFIDWDNNTVADSEPEV